MAQLVTKLRVFIASPDDVGQERKKMEEIMAELNHGIAAEKNIVLELIRWETHTWPGFGRDAQDVINEQVEPYDIFIGIMWNRFGTPTNVAQSGTVEEFERAYALWKTHKQPKLLFYFNRTPSDFNNIESLNQKQKVLEFKLLLQSLGAFYWEYDSVDSFTKEISRHLTSEIRKWDSNLTKTISTKQISEQFCSLNFWGKLNKVGYWEIENIELKDKCLIVGKGVYSFLLSENIYGDTAFTIRTSIRFYNYEKFREEKTDTANAGIVFGWKDNVENNQYYNLLFSGEYIVLEEIGSDGQDDYFDFRHLAKKVSFKIEEGRFYQILISLTQSVMNVFIDEKIIYSIASPRSLTGKVGIRPWRAQIECNYFEVTRK